MEVAVADVAEEGDLEVRVARRDERLERGAENLQARQLMICSALRTMQIERAL